MVETFSLTIRPINVYTATAIAAKSASVSPYKCNPPAAESAQAIKTLPKKVTAIAAIAFPDNLPFIKSSSKQDVKIRVDIGYEIERNMQVYLPTGKILEHDEVSTSLKRGSFVSTVPISRHYKVDANGLIALYDTSKDVTLVYENDEKYKFRLVYNGNADNYICIEPQTGMANSPNSPFDRDYAGFTFIKSGASETYKSKIYIKEGNI